MLKTLENTCVTLFERLLFQIKLQKTLHRCFPDVDVDIIYIYIYIIYNSMIAQLVRASERTSLVVGSNLTQVNFL